MSILPRQKIRGNSADCTGSDLGDDGGISHSLEDPVFRFEHHNVADVRRIFRPHVLREGTEDFRSEIGMFSQISRHESKLFTVGKHNDASQRLGSLSAFQIHKGLSH